MSRDMLPPAVRLHFVPARATPAHDGPPAFTVEARDTRRPGDLVWQDSIRGMGEWLNRNGFRYIAGTQALWSRPDAPPTFGPFGPFGLNP